MNDRKPPLGAAAEELACEHLRSRGYEIVARNFRCRVGEIDIVARLGATTVFVEVKERTDAGRGAGFEAVTAAKRARVIGAAQLFASKKGLSEGLLRFDVISVGRADSRPTVRHDVGAFDADGR